MLNSNFIILLCCLSTVVTYSQTGYQSTSYTANTNNITGNRTVAIGLNTSTTSGNSVLIGSGAGMNSSPISSVCIGYFSGRNSTGGSNTFVGSGAGNLSVNSSDNVALGINSGSTMDGAERNLFLGTWSGSRNEGDDNVFLGNNAGYNNKGNENVFIGTQSGLGNSTGAKNVYIGGFSANINVGSRNIFIGDQAGKTAQNLSDRLIIENSDATIPLIYGDFANNKVGINTTNLINTIGGQNINNYSLYVEGGLLSDEVRVRTTWADYVFEEHYALQSIKELESYIDQNGHLPNCPSGKEVNEKGIEVGNITRIQQEKIEELTLYIIQQDKEIKHNTSMLEEQAKLIAELKNLLIKKVTTSEKD